MFYSNSWCSGNWRLCEFCSARVRKGLSCHSTCIDGVIVVLVNTCVVVCIVCCDVGRYGKVVFLMTRYFPLEESTVNFMIDPLP